MIDMASDEVDDNMPILPDDETDEDLEAEEDELDDSYPSEKKIVDDDEVDEDAVK